MVNIDLSYLIQSGWVYKMQNNPIKLGVPGKEGQLSIMFAKGGPREGAGRKGIGETKKISLTLSKEVWETLQQRCDSLNRNRSEMIRNIIEAYFSMDSENKDVNPLVD
jgi:hypothetical protein